MTGAVGDADSPHWRTKGSEKPLLVVKLDLKDAPPRGWGRCTAAQSHVSAGVWTGTCPSPFSCVPNWGCPTGAGMQLTLVAGSVGSARGGGCGFRCSQSGFFLPQNRSRAAGPLLQCTARHDVLALFWRPSSCWLEQKVSVGNMGCQVKVGGWEWVLRVPSVLTMSWDESGDLGLYHAHTMWSFAQPYRGEACVYLWGSMSFVSDIIQLLEPVLKTVLSLH